MRKKIDFPQWALEHWRSGTELRCIRGKFYLYECKCVYDKVKKRCRKVTGKYLGTVTEEKGLVPPRHRYVAVEDHSGESDKSK